MISHSEARALVERQARAWEAEDYPAMTADFAPDGVFISPGGRWQGHGQIRSAAEAFFAVSHSVRIAIGRVVWDGERMGACEWTWQETRRADGKILRAEDAIVFELDDAGKIVYWREYFDTAQMT
ncbi:MAG: nuclear transport factor 2 family protein [Chloroflexota bacterium]